MQCRAQRDMLADAIDREGLRTAFDLDAWTAGPRHRCFAWMSEEDDSAAA